MPASDYFKWNKRFSLVYALGAWTLCGSLAYYRYTHKEPLGKLKDALENNGNVTLRVFSAHAS